MNSRHTGNIDEETLLRLKNGDKRTFEALYWKYSGKLHNFVLSLLYDKSLAEDITQTCFLKIWEHRGNIDIKKSFSAYLFTIARNLVYDETERSLRADEYATRLQDFLETGSDHTEKEIDAIFMESEIDKYIDQLPAERRRIFLLSRKDGLTNKEIAARLSISEKTVETQIYRSIKYLKEKLGFLLVLQALVFLLRNL